MINLVATAFWLFTAYIVVRLIRVDRFSVGVSRAGWILRIGLMAASIFVFFRPHEDIKSGQDPGVYVNTAGAIMHHGALFYTDEMLEQVPVENRDVFFFGHLQGYNLTKDSCLHVKERDSALIGPRFPVLYPVALSLVMRASGTLAALHVVPLFAILAGYALCVLAGLVFRRSEAGPIAFLFYVCMPHVIWHARAPRPEIIASFFCLAGLVLVLNAAESPSRSAIGDVLYAAIAVALAPFLHVTAWFVAVAMVIPVGILLLRGRSDFLVYPVVAVAGVVAYIHQTITVADQYQLAPKLKPLLEPRSDFAVIIVAALVLALVVNIIGRHLNKRGAWSWLSRRLTPAIRLTICATLSLAFIILCAYLYLRTDPVTRRTFEGYVYHYIYPTDLRLLRIFLSRSVCVLGGIGLILMILSTKRTQAHFTVLVALLPNTFLMGNMYDFFMTRYFLIAACPLIVLGLSKTVTTLPLPARVRPVVISLLAIGVCALLVYRRATMVTTTEYKGLTTFIQEFADEITHKNGVLLAEYTRLAAPFEHLHGIPLLSLDNETRDNYLPAMEAWDSIMARHPNRPAFFLTPFSAPISDLFDFEPVRSETLVYDTLPAGRNQLPTSPQSRSMTLSLYSMTRRENLAPPAPYVRGLDGSNMGIEGFVLHNRLKDTRQWAITGHALRSGVPGHIRFKSGVEIGGASRLVVFAALDGGGTRNAGELVNADGLRLTWRHLDGAWWVGEVRSDSRSRISGLDITPSKQLLVSDIHFVSGGRAARVSTVPSEEGSHQVGFAGRWARPPSRFLAPLPTAEKGVVCLLIKAPDDTGQQTEVSIATRYGTLGSRTVETGKWSWEVWPVGKGQTGGTQWLKLQVAPVWKPGLNGYPDDLAVHVGYITCLPMK